MDTRWFSAFAGRGRCDLVELCRRAEEEVQNVHFTCRHLTQRARSKLAAQYPPFLARTIHDVPRHYPLKAWRFVCVEEFDPLRDLPALHRLLHNVSDMFLRKRQQNKPLARFKVYNETTRRFAREGRDKKHRESQLRKDVADAQFMVA